MPARLAWLTIGLLALGAGIAGVILPLVPATPFLLVATFSFARSSPRLHDWLVTHPRLGPPIRDWNTYGAINRQAKYAAMGVMALTLAVSAAAGVSQKVLAIQLAAMSAAALFILTRPNGPDDQG